MPVAIVIAGARRIGAAIVRGLASTGYDIGLTYHTSHQHALELCDEIRLMNRRCQTIRCDVTQPPQLEGALQTFSDTLGMADVVIYNAGVFPQAQHPSKVRESDVMDAIRVNAIPVLTVARTYDALCQQHDHTGRIIVLGSLGAREIWRDRVAYNTSKAAQQTLVLSLARSLAPRISMNIVSPGIIEQAEEAHTYEKEIVGIRRIPMNRPGRTEDVVDAVRYFASCTPYITGQTIVVDGGYGLVR